MDTHTLNNMSPDNIFILIENLSMLLSCLCRASYPSRSAFLDVTPAPANSARLRSTNPNLLNERPPLHSFLTEIRNTQRSKTPVEAFAIILHGNENFAPHFTVWSRTSSLKQRKKTRTVLVN